ncbi:MAG: nucleoside triphosphate pyrophosphohydrolase [Pseudomonadota bacterium]
MASAREFEKLVEMMRRLRGPGGCPWDREQTSESIAPYCLEEAYEVVDAIEGGERAKLRDELGDLLLQVVFHSQMAKEEGSFDIHDVARAINEKLIRRHPHVFRKGKGDQASSPEAVLKKWAKIKNREGRKHLLDGIPSAMPALLRATRIGEKAASVGFDWKGAKAVWKKVEEELNELRKARGKREAVMEELGDLLLALTSLARHLKVDAELALRRATKKFERRFRWMEEKVRVSGKELSDLTAKELDRLWNQSKTQ